MRDYDENMNWTYMGKDAGSGGYTYCLKVPGGWLYRVDLEGETSLATTMVFVPKPKTKVDKPATE